MEHDELKKRQKRNVVIIETFMVFAVVVIVAITLLATMGFNFNRKGEVEQSGLMQLHTMPTGASINLDGENLFARTNTSRSLSPGEHWLEVTRDGYDKWEKVVKMSPGHLMRLYYPRLFLQERKGSEVSNVRLKEAKFYQTSKGRNYLLYGDYSGKWQLVDVKSDDVKIETIDVKAIFSEKEGDVEIIPDRFVWSKDENRVLVHAMVDKTPTWAVINFKIIKESINITKKFNFNFSDIRLASNSVMRLWAVENGNIHILDVGTAYLSSVLVHNVADFAVYDGDLIYVTNKKENGKRTIGYYQDSAKASVILKEIDNSEQPVRLAISHYYDEDFLVYMIGNHLQVWGGQFADLNNLITDEKTKTIDLESGKSKMTKFTDKELGITPDRFVVNNGGEFVLGNVGNQFAAIDLDTGETYQYDRSVSSIQWIDDDMMYGVVDGKLLVWDFDGWNTRELANGVTNDSVMISKNDKFIYYVSSGKLMRMQILD